MNALKNHWCETTLLSQAVLKHVVFKEFTFKKSVQGTNSVAILPRMKKFMTLFHIKNYFSCHVILLKRKLQHVGHKWVICWSHLDCSVGQWIEWLKRCDPLSTLLGSSLCDMTSPLALRIEFDSTISTTLLLDTKTYT